MPSIHHHGPKLVLTIMHHVLTYAPTVGLFGVAYKENVRETGKSFILSGKIMEKSVKMNSAK